MLAFGIRYLNGFVAAAEPDNLERAEWPPHPGRVFMALAAAHFQTGADPAEREALLWLEGSNRDGEISAPQIAAPEAMQRAIVKHYVPVNDKAGPSKAVMQTLPVTRDRQDRTFARAWLDDDTVSLVWPDLDPPGPHRRALEQLCGKVTRIGHSSSLVQMWIAGESELVEPNWLPDDDRAGLRLRIAGPGTLEYLEQEYNVMAVEDYANLKVQSETADEARTRRAARQKLRQQYDNRPPPQRRPQLALYQGYARPESGSEELAGPGTVFHPHVITLRLERQDSAYRALDLGSTLTVTTRWREAIISHSNDETAHVRALLTGHDAGGKALKAPHLAFLPLAFVGHEHADGHLLGM
ncbi:MAG TPA: type I-U CRISPR-associated protein Csb2, partial [Wenzhouxiangella sp.]|nr:type I-U CRISPR-associated protein Csb2 [Wenzhouxiangella sp.]